MEVEVLGSILLEPDLIKDIIDQVKSTNFYSDDHKDIFKSMAYLHHNNQPIDYTTVLDRLDAIKSNVDTDYVLGLTDSVASTVNFDYKVERLLDLSHKRDLYELGEWLTTQDLTGIASENIIKMINQSVDNVKITSNIEITDMKEYIDDWYGEFVSPTKASDFGFGMKLLDEHILLKPKNLGIIAARPSIGKSAYALFIAANFALQGKKTLFVSLEMSKEEVTDRLVSRFARVNYRKIQRKLPLDSDEKISVENAIKKIKSLPLQIYDKGMFSVDHLYNLAKVLGKKREVDVILVDYLQLLDGGKRENASDNSRVSYISRKLKLIAQDLDVPVIALSQLSRASIERDGKPREPQLSDLRDSGSLEQDSNYVIMLHTDDTEDRFVDKQFVKAFIRKNRSGKKGVVNLTYFGNYMSFEEKEFVEGQPVSVKPTVDINYVAEESEDSDEELPF